MCILFLFVDDKPSSGAHQVILAFNRDEAFSRPTAPAKFWSEQCLSGLDLEPGKEGGTWLGTSKSSRTGALLNILQNVSRKDKKGRGHLVSNFLTGTEDAESYIGRIGADRHSYNAFNLVLIEKKDGEWVIQYCTTEDETTPRRMPTGVSVFGNSVHGCPWQKAVHGKRRFEEIIAASNSASNRAELKDSLLEMLKDNRTYSPDPQMDSQFPPGCPPEIQTSRSAIFVNSLKKFPYGTRTNTILLIDDVGHCEYLERTISDYGDVINPVWTTVTHEYDLTE